MTKRKTFVKYVTKSSDWTTEYSACCGGCPQTETIFVWNSWTHLFANSVKFMTRALQSSLGRPFFFFWPSVVACPIPPVPLTLSNLPNLSWPLLCIDYRRIESSYFPKLDYSLEAHMSWTDLLMASWGIAKQLETDCLLSYHLASTLYTECRYEFIYPLAHGQTFQHKPSHKNAHRDSHAYTQTYRHALTLALSSHAFL